MIRDYELMVVFLPELEESVIDDWLTKIEAIVTNSSGFIYKKDKWGRKHLAYEVRHKSEGFYVVIDFTSDREGILELDRVLRLSDDVLRHKIIKLPTDVANKLKTELPKSKGAKLNV